MFDLLVAVAVAGGGALVATTAAGTADAAVDEAAALAVVRGVRDDGTRPSEGTSLLCAGTCAESAGAALADATTCGAVGAAAMADSAAAETLVTSGAPASGAGPRGLSNNAVGIATSINAPIANPASNAGRLRAPPCVAVPQETPVDPDWAAAAVSPGSADGRIGTPAAASIARARSALTDAEGGPKGTRAEASSATFWNRSAGFFRRQVSIAATTCGGTSGRSDVSARGSSIRTFAQSSGICSASNGTFPVSDS